MTPEQDNVIRAQARRCAEGIKKAMRQKPKPNWDSTVKPILKKHYEVIKPIGISLIGFNSVIGRLHGRYGVES
ncbi:hypothetical protein [Enterobacter kobei]|uniref:Uncharacterized protein n=2 Tax=Enterobacter kobei TaxID=208224 RepID=A0AA86M8M2_9ENTR|nr:hypothetical protein [Enterobacter kobei]OLR21497.1 hypothetical protein BH713_13000 [Enterobacter kobei]BCU55107.1 hypothetical protein ENKO_17010 [Enterobacter kobei]SIQ96578.1 hypothetical protein SAMN05444841_102612 [Enterobacter kobei]